MNPYNFSLLCFGFCSFLLGIFIWLRRQDKIGTLYLSLSFFYTGWSTIIAISLSDNISYDFALLTGRVANGFAAFIPVIWFHFCLVFTQREKRYKKLLFILYLNPIFIDLFIFTKWFIPFMQPMVGFQFYSTPGPVYYIKTISYFVIVALGFWLLYRRMQEVKGVEKEQVKGLLWTSLVGYLGGSLTFFPIYGIPLPQYGLFLMPIYPFAMAYFLVRRGLFNIEELAQAAHRDKLTAVGVLAASINHEVKNPLFVIKGLAESWLERRKEGVFKDDRQIIEQGEDSMRRAMAQADRAMDIIKRLSLFAKAGIDSEIKFEAVKIEEMIENILPLIRYELAAHNIALIRELPADLPDVRADRRYLEEILFNLLVNAVQAVKGMNKADGEIKLTARADSQQVQITVQDNGPGIPEEKLKDVFRPFYTTKQEGTGLGLYITQQLVEKINGRITVRSQAGMGTIFTVRLPVNISSAL